MGRKYLNRKINSRYNKPDISAEDEWSHITSLGERIDIQDVMDVQQRKFFLHDDHEEQKTQWEKTKDETRNAMDVAGNASQYLKYVNSYLKKKNAKIKDIKKIKEVFDEDLKLLKTNRQNIDFPQLIHQHKNEDLKKIKKYLTERKVATKKYLNKLKQEVWQAENDLQNQQYEIEELERHIISDKSNKTESNEAHALKEKIISLCNEYELETVSDILDELESSLKSKKGEEVFKR